MYKHKNILVVYQGGGYDGCFWEWNHFLFDDKGEFHVIFASGSAGIKKVEAALEFMADPERFEEDKAEIIHLDKEGDIDHFQKEWNAGFVVETVRRVNFIYEEADFLPPMWFKCDDCGEKVYERGCSDVPEGAGGIMIVHTKKYCEECYCCHHCPYCAEFFEDTSVFDTETGYCEYCNAEQKEKAQ